MANEKMTALAQQVYQTVCQALDERQWKYDKDEEKYVVHFGVNGEDIPMQFIILVDIDRQMIRLLSPLPFKMGEDKRAEGAIATSAASLGMADGSFDYDINNGRIVYRMTASFRDSQIGVGMIQYLISCGCAMVDEYNDRFMAINKGVLSIQEFLDKDKH